MRPIYSRLAPCIRKCSNLFVLVTEIENSILSNKHAPPHHIHIRDAIAWKIHYSFLSIIFFSFLVEYIRANPITCFILLVE